MDTGAESVAMCAVGHKRKDLISHLRAMGLEVNVYDYHPHLNVNGEYHQVDIIFDDVKFTEDLIVHCSAERTYPIGRVHTGEFILLLDNTDHNGSCTIYSQNVFETMALENNLVSHAEMKLGSKYILHGLSLQ